jgi:hypothetical protein
MKPRMIPERWVSSASVRSSDDVDAGGTGSGVYGGGLDDGSTLLTAMLLG